jgi:hypothetical protein
VPVFFPLAEAVAINPGDTWRLTCNCPALPGAFTRSGVLHRNSPLYGAFVWARRVLDGPFRRFFGPDNSMERTQTTRVGPTNKHEMCNLYLMYPPPPSLPEIRETDRDKRDTIQASESEREGGREEREGGSGREGDRERHGERER